MDYNFRDIEQKWQKRWVENGTSMFTILASANYLFNVADQLDVYPIAGLGIGHSSTSFEGHESISSTNFIGQIGAGTQYNFTDKFAVNFDAKVQFSKSTAFVIAAGIIYKL